MALIICPECGREVSEFADSCPNCGYRIEKTKYCKHCGELIPESCVVCVKCGKKVEDVKEKIIINNNITNTVPNATRLVVGKEKNKWVSLLLCIFIGFLGAHKFYEGKIGMGILYIFTGGLLGIGWIVDIIMLALKPNPYYV